MSAGRKKKVVVNEEEAKPARAVKMNGEDSAAKASLSMIIQLLPEGGADSNVDVATKHLKEMMEMLEKQVRGGVTKSAGFRAKLSVIIDLLEHTKGADRNVAIAVDALKKI